jgi:cadmium resistance protein CadD (predicted permease)
VSSLPASAATAVALFAATNVDDLVVLALLSAASRAAGRPRRWEIWSGQYLGFAVLVGLSLAAGRGLSLVPARWLWLLALIPLIIGVVTLATAIRAARHGEPPTPPLAAGQPSGPGPSGTAGPSGMPGPLGMVGSSGMAGSSGVAGSSEVAGPSGVVGSSGMAGPSGVGGLPAVPGLSNGGWLAWMAGVVGVGTLTVIDGADNLAAYTPVFATADADRIAVTLVVFAVGVAVWCAAGGLLTRHHRITDTLQRYGRWVLPAAFILIGLYTLHATNAPIRP